MADPNEDDAVPVVIESSWNVLQGSLDSNLTVVFVDPSTREPIISAAHAIPSEKLVLVPSSESHPCEITVKFQKRLCNVESLYILSTSRICELYSQTKYEDDQEYICTVKGWISAEDGLEEAPSEDCSSLSENGDLKPQESLDMLEKGQIAITKRPSTEASDTECLKNSSPSSGLPDGFDRSDDSYEDSWVDVKLTSLSSESDIHIAETSKTASTENCQSNTVPELKSDDLKFCDSSNGNIQKHAGAKQDMYEAELELVDQNAWAAFTIRLLSLQDKCRVEINQIVLLVAPGPPIPKNEDRGGTNGNSAMLAMFLPSMLQMAKGLSLSKVEERADQNVPKLSCGSNLSNKKQCISNSSSFPPSSENIGSSNCIMGDTSIAALSTDTLGVCSTSGVDNTLKLDELEESNKHENIGKNLEMHTESSRSSEPPLSNLGCPPGEVLSGPLAKYLLNTLQSFSERFDRLEKTCMRMESYLEKTVERMDQRIMLLEASHSKDSAEISPSNELEKKSPKDVCPIKEHHSTEGSCQSAYSNPHFSFKYEGNARPDNVATILVHDCNPVVDLISSSHAGMPRNEPDIVSDHAITQIRPQEIQDADSGSLSAGTVSRQTSATETTAGTSKLGKPCGSLEDAAWMMLSAFTCSFKTDRVTKDLENSSDLMTQNQSSRAQKTVKISGLIMGRENENNAESEIPRIATANEFDSEQFDGFDSLPNSSDSLHSKKNRGTESGVGPKVALFSFSDSIVGCENENNVESEAPRIEQVNESDSFPNSSDSIHSRNNRGTESGVGTKAFAFSSNDSMGSETNIGRPQSHITAKISFYSSDSMCSVSNSDPQFDGATKFFSSYSSDSMGSEKPIENSMGSLLDETTKVSSTYSSYNKTDPQFDVATKVFAKDERLESASCLDEQTEGKVVQGTFSENIAETCLLSRDLFDAGDPIGKELGSVQGSLRPPLFDLDSNDLPNSHANLQPPLVDLQSSQDNLHFSSSRSENQKTVVDDINLLSINQPFVDDVNYFCETDSKRSSFSRSGESNTGVRDGRFIDVNKDPLIIDWLTSPAPDNPEPTNINLNDTYDCGREFLHSATISKLQNDTQPDTSLPDLFGDSIKGSQEELHGINFPDLLGGNLLDLQGSAEDSDSSDMKWFSAKDTFHSQDFQSPFKKTDRKESSSVVLCSVSEVESVFPGFDNLL